jgi:hypothetical protein
MNNPLGVRRFQCFGDLARAIERPRDRQRPVQGLALHKFQDQAIHVARFLQAVDGRDIGMIQRSQRARLAAEASQLGNAGGGK